ncbi:hypothetical protein NM208_g11659 [Fusarium decemcellulare]|uniref:Uncharacterized protein n=1 Tax=Fusarium decemcellulare TaxID=57161 RepID=A0ACC1RUH6_9HYPO|nr:hypothetical protein NM208_g11659 [Fusarium decemcellulare]
MYNEVCTYCRVVDRGIGLRRRGVSQLANAVFAHAREIRDMPLQIHIGVNPSQLGQFGVSAVTPFNPLGVDNHANTTFHATAVTRQAWIKLRKKPFRHDSAARRNDTELSPAVCLPIRMNDPNWLPPNELPDAKAGIPILTDPAANSRVNSDTSKARADKEIHPLIDDCATSNPVVSPTAVLDHVLFRARSI